MVGYVRPCCTGDSYLQPLCLKAALVIFLIESCIITGSLLAGAVLRLWRDPDEFAYITSEPSFWGKLLLVAVIYQACLLVNQLYDLKTPRHRVTDLACIGQAIGSASLILTIAYVVFPDLIMGRGIFLIGAVIVTLGLAISRTAFGAIWGAATERLLILGAGETACLVLNELEKRLDLGFRIVGVLREDVAAAACALRLHPIVLGHTGDLVRVVREARISRIIVAMEERRGRLPIAELVSLRMQGIVVEEAQSLMAAVTGRVWLRFLQPSWFVFSNGFHRSRVTALLKRTMDIFVSVLGIVAASPLMLLVAILIKLDSRGPCLYRQVRVGLKGQEFEVLKFRSMREDAEADGHAQWASNQDPRATRIGKQIRRFRLDELPQFWNILRGEMSCVGPRPERPVFVAELRKQILYYDERHSVRPGLTGWAQVCFHYGASMEDAFRKLEYDLFYLKNMSIVYDLMILVRTVQIVLLGWEHRPGTDIPASDATEPFPLVSERV